MSCQLRSPNLVVTISQKSDGNCYFAPTGNPEVDEATPVNRATFIAKNSVPKSCLVTAGLTHGSEVRRAVPADGGTIIQDVDALFTDERDLFLSITVADCLPIFLFDPATQTVGLIHAGWRGLAANIVTKTISAMIEHCDVRAKTLLVGIGPCIGPCHFEVKEDVARRFEAFPSAVVYSDGKFFIDLPMVARAQLMATGVVEKNITTMGICTYDHAEKYFSYRRDKPAFKETMMAVIGLR